MQKLSGLFILLVLGISACVSVAELPERVKMQAALPEKIESVTIGPTTIMPGAIKNVDSLNDAPQFFARSLKTALETKQLSWQIPLNDERSDKSDADIKKQGSGS